jgi:DNA-binding transcriptional regulator YdaS (Cro superfamily)
MGREVLNEAVSRAVSILGTQSALARALSQRTERPIRQGQVWNWIYRNGKPDPTLCGDIEALTQGQVTRYDLRPDVFGAAPTQDV